MDFIPLTAGRGAHLLAIDLQNLLKDGKHVLWLISGGSNLPLTVEVMNELAAPTTKLLTIMPIDERYGKPGHLDSNMQQLYDLGFSPKQATVFNPLDGSPITTTVKRYTEFLQLAMDKADVVVAQIGMGADGHIAGILPNSTALSASGLVTSYDGPDYQRMTLTPAAIRRVDIAYLFAYGREKRAALDRLCDGDFPMTDQPAQVLRELKDVTIYNDQLEERNA